VVLPKTIIVTLFLLALLPTLFTLSLSIGAYRLYSPLDILRVAISGGSDVDLAVIELRLWRSIAAISVGVGLAVSGLVIQRLLGNPMADPYILGISPGAALGYLIAVSLGLGLPLWYLLSFLGGLAAYSTIVVLASLAGLTSLALIVVGVSLSYVFSSASIILLYLLGPQAGLALSWIFGSVAYVPRGSSLTLALVVLAALTVVVTYRGALTALLLGDETAKALGVRVELLRLALTAAIAFTVSVITAVAGPVGFIGLTAPWIARVAYGADFSKLLLPTIVIGATLGLGSDVVVRAVGGGRELPLTAITALLGAPVLLYLSIRGRDVGRL